jgi:hypothetical protein
MKDVVADLAQKKNIPQVILAILFLIFLVSSYPLPYSLSTVIDTVYGKMIVILVCIILFLYTNPIVGVLGMLVGFQLIMKSSLEQGTFVEKTNNMQIMNRKIKRQQTDSLEHEVIRKMAPTSNDFGITVERDKNIHPVMSNLYDASPVNATN